jgi:hypothetical protein
VLFFTDSTKKLQFCVLSLPILVMATSLATSGPAPLTSDEGRFTGFAIRIIKDGKWIPYQYYENDYYQLFHVVPFLKALLGMIMSADIINTVHPLLVLLLTLFTTLAIYTLTRRILGLINEGSEFQKLATLSPIIFLCSPTISTLEFIPQWVAASLYLLTFLIIISKPYCKAGIALVLLLSLAGVMIHAAYPILMLTSLGTLMMANALKGTKLSGLFKYVMIVALTYWTHTIILDSIIDVGRGWFSRLIELHSESMRVAQVQAEYSSAPSWMAYPWTLLPSFAFSTIFLKLVEKILNRRAMNALERFIVELGVFGLMFLMLGFISRMFSLSHVALVRYSYASYLLLLPASIYAMRQVLSKGKMINILLIALIITSSAFCAIHDPKFSPDVFKFTTDADKRSWIVARTFGALLSPNIKYSFDTRIGIGIEALILGDHPELYGKKPENAQIVIVALDNVGKANLNFWFGSKWVKIIESGNYSIIFSDGCYKAYMKIIDERQ